MIDKDLYDTVCDTLDGQTDADGLCHCGFSLLVLGLSRMPEAQREAELSVLGFGITSTLEQLDELRERKKQLNGHGRGLAQ